tara:strand:- start:8082 stop:8624 length:543 start_codon:yes stop_codon:yes gene_type:complete
MKLIPLEPPFDPAIESILNGYPKQDGYLLGLFRVFANSARFLAGKGVSNLLDKDSPLALRQREIVILRTCANFNCEYEWGVHVAIFAKAAGLSKLHTDETRLNQKLVVWSETEQLLIDVVDNLCRSAALEQGLLGRFQDLYSAEQQLEILSLVGNYYLVSLVANTSRLGNEDFAARFPLG